MAASASAWDLHLHLHPCLHQLPLFHLLPTASPPPLQAAPMAYLVEQAGGLATTGKTRIMDLVPQNVHQRVPVILGSPDDVKECRRYYDAFTASATMDGSDEAKAIRARCFTRLTPGQLVDTTMTKEPDSIALDTTGDGTVDKVVPIEDKDKYMKK